MLEEFDDGSCGLVGWLESLIAAEMMDQNAA
jgi:hypothetical protein